MVEAATTRSDAPRTRASSARRRGPTGGWFYAGAAATAVAGFTVGLVLSGGAERLVTDEVALEVADPPSTTTTTAVAASSTTVRAVPTTPASAAASTPTSESTTTALPATTTLLLPTTTTLLPTTTAVATTIPPSTTAAPVPTTWPLPVATSVPHGATGTSPLLTVAYAGQETGFLRVGRSQVASVVVSNRGGTTGSWTVQASGYVMLPGGNGQSGQLRPGESIAIAVVGAADVPSGAGGALTLSFPNGMAVLPILVGQ